MTRYFALLLLPLAACDLPPPDPVLVAERCEARAQAALGPTGTISVGVNNRRGAQIGGAVAVTSDFLNGRDPEAVYLDCVQRATGQPPIRPLNLR